MRRTKAAEIYRKTGNLRTVQLLLGHTKVDSTVRYLGVELDDALSIAERDRHLNDVGERLLPFANPVHVAVHPGDADRIRTA